MRRRPRWGRWGLLAGVAITLGAVPVGARTERAAPRPPLRVEVRYGDSLWTLARRYGDPSRDVRDIVAEVMRANSISPQELQPGVELVIPAECLPRR